MKKLQLDIRMSGLVTVEMEDDKAAALIARLEQFNVDLTEDDFGLDLGEIINDLDMEVEDAWEVGK